MTLCERRTNAVSAAVWAAVTVSAGCFWDGPEPADEAPAKIARTPPRVGATLWQDEFDTLDPSRWNVTTSESGEACRSDGERFNNEGQAYTSNTDCARADHNLCVGNGTAKLVVRKANAIGCAGWPASYTSTRMNTKGKAGFVPTPEHPAIRIEARIRMPAPVAGIWPAFWTLGRDVKQGPILGDDTNDWPDVGEIDIAEAGWAWDESRHTFATVHDSPGDRSTWDGENHRMTKAGRQAIGRNEWHTYAVDWRTDSIGWSVDGVPFGDEVDLRALPSHDFEHEHFVLLNFAIGGAGGGKTIAGDAFFPSNGADYTPEQVMEVDWVRVVALEDPAPAP